MSDYKEFFSELRGVLESALQGETPVQPDIEGLKKAVDDLSEQVKSIARALHSGDESEEPGEIAKAMAELREMSVANREALEKALDRIEALEGATLARKSAAGEDTSYVVSKRQDLFGEVVKRILAGEKVNLA